MSQQLSAEDLNPLASMGTGGREVDTNRKEAKVFVKKSCCLVNSKALHAGQGVYIAKY